MNIEEALKKPDGYCTEIEATCLKSIDSLVAVIPKLRYGGLLTVTYLDYIALAASILNNTISEAQVREVFGKYGIINEDELLSTIKNNNCEIVHTFFDNLEYTVKARRKMPNV
jgi:hypothetical protein